MFKELSETIELMNSKDYKKRFIAEYHQLKIRYEKLKNFCNKIEAAKITGRQAVTTDCPLELLREQQKQMRRYLQILEIRAEIEEILL